jgi:serpin B
LPFRAIWYNLSAALAGIDTREARRLIMYRRTILVLVPLVLCPGLYFLGGCLSMFESRLIAPSSTDTAVVVEGNTRFACELYDRLRVRQGNVFFSPFSISTALAMTSAGARGETLAEMERTLHLPAQEQLHPALGRVLDQESTASAGVQLHVANALWRQRGMELSPAFLDKTRRHYGAGVPEVDFNSEREKARQEINGWVEQKTHQRIRDLLQPGIVDADSRLVLVNAIYFKGNWATQFSKSATHEGPFYLADGRSVQVPLMSQKANFGYLQQGDVQVLEMPYTGKDLSMVILLPARATALGDLEARLTPENLTAWLKDLPQEKVDATLPRFQLTWEASLKPTLSEMGMALAFREGADFSGMNDGREPLSLKAVVHKAFVEVNEEGTEAAAATGAVARSLSLPVVPTFRADHPFVFLIRDRRNGSILFMGRYCVPG